MYNPNDLASDEDLDHIWYRDIHREGSKNGIHYYWCSCCHVWHIDPVR